MNPEELSQISQVVSNAVADAMEKQLDGFAVELGYDDTHHMRAVTASNIQKYEMEKKMGVAMRLTVIGIVTSGVIAMFVQGFKIAMKVGA